MYDMDLDTDGYSVTETADTLHQTNDLSAHNYAVYAAASSLIAFGVGCTIVAFQAEEHLEDGQGNLVYRNNGGLFDGAEFYVQDADGGYVQLPSTMSGSSADQGLPSSK